MSNDSNFSTFSGTCTQCKIYLQHNYNKIDGLNQAYVEGLGLDVSCDGVEVTACWFDAGGVETVAVVKGDCVDGSTDEEAGGCGGCPFEDSVLGLVSADCPSTYNSILW